MNLKYTAPKAMISVDNKTYYLIREKKSLLLQLVDDYNKLSDHTQRELIMHMLLDWFGLNPNVILNQNGEIQLEHLIHRFK